MLTHEEDVRALDNARLRMPQRFHPTSKQTEQRINLIESALNETGCTPEKMLEIHENQRKELTDKFVLEEEAKIMQERENYVQFAKASFKFFESIFHPEILGVRFQWARCAKDRLAGIRSPSFSNLLRSELPSLPSPLALSDPEAFKAQIRNVYDDLTIEWQFDRYTLPDGASKYGSADRWFKATIHFKR